MARKLRPYAGIAELMEHDLIERGVPKEKIVRVAHNAENTGRSPSAGAASPGAQMAERNCGDLQLPHPPRPLHLPAGVSRLQVRVTGSHDGDFDPEQWWQTRQSLKELTWEFTPV